jgi:hypothetical protein
VLNAELCKGASFTWQSIHAGIKTFKRGCISRVGTGEKINIWTDPWIPSRMDRKIMTNRGNMVYTKVEELINPVTNQWDEDILRSFF